MLAHQGRALDHFWVSLVMHFLLVYHGGNNSWNRKGGNRDIQDPETSYQGAIQLEFFSWELRFDIGAALKQQWMKNT